VRAADRNVVRIQKHWAGGRAVAARFACGLPDLRFDAELIEKSWLKNLKNRGTVGITFGKEPAAKRPRNSFFLNKACLELSEFGLMEG
jgi:hypothetical protein